MRRRLFGGIGQRRALEGLDQEIRDHLEREIEVNLARGMPPDEARRQACLAFGNVALVQEDSRAIWTWAWLEHAYQDGRYALRTLRRSPGFTAAAVRPLSDAPCRRRPVHQDAAEPVVGGCQMQVMSQNLSTLQVRAAGSRAALT